MIDPGELPGPPEPPPPDVVIDVQSPPPPPPGAPQPLVFTAGTEPTVHGLVGTYFGDLEIDHGNSVRWLAFFTDDLFITDVNTGEQRYWVIDWSALFPTSEHTVTGRNFFRDAANWRREQFEYGAKAFHYDDNDWCIFIDGSDGLSFDHRSRPDDYNAAPFMSWVYREVERAMDAGRDYATFPLFIYLHESDLQTITYGLNTTPDAVAAGIPAVTKTMAVPWYLPYQGLTRLWKVSALRNPSFDWTRLDTPTAPSPAVKAQIISYAYAHWSPLDIPPGQTEVPPLSPSNDHGYKMRNLISLMRPIPGIPFGEPWKDLSLDPTGVPGPWGIDVIAGITPFLVTTVEEDGHTPPDVATAGVLTPIYTSVVRQNLRDGLWYEEGTYGNIPLTWDATAGKWVPLYDPDQWPLFGLESHTLPSPPRSPTSLRLGGGAGDYVSTQDDPFDIRFTFSLAVCLALDKWTDSEQNIVSQAQAWAWTLEADGDMTFSRSRDGSTFHDFTIPAEEVPAWADKETVVIGVSYATVVPPDITIKPVDEVRFWIWDGEEWGQLGDTQSELNDDDAEIFNSTAPVRIGGGTPGLFRVVSIRPDVGDDNGIGNGEMARMRGDITSNPSYDRYGNTWTNYGTWSNEDMQNMPNLPLP